MAAHLSIERERSWRYFCAVRGWERKLISPTRLPRENRSGCRAPTDEGVRRIRMGEVIVSGAKSMEVMSQEEYDTEQNDEPKETPSTVVKWERLLPRVVLRVLLVEADDSTRQIIAALLRKCSYRVVAVGDGLKAWETLKGRPHNIDLILTELELPSISGFALLTLVMEHEICKNIPVIMMSSHDSITMALKCMLKGAADFLIKPVRRNELTNLWQHVWRRHTPTSGHVPQKLTVAKCGVEATSENDAASNHSSDYMPHKQKSKGCSEKGSEAQGISWKKCRSASNLCNTEKERCEGCSQLNEESVMPESETREKSIRLGSEAAPCNEAHNLTALRIEENHTRARTMTRHEVVGPESCGEITGETYSCNDESVEPSSGAIDLIGTFNNRSECSYGHSSSNDGTNYFGWAPQLELSLRRFYPNSSKDQGTDERQMLNHSNASAFSWYNNGKTLQPLFPTVASNCTDADESVSNSHKQLSNQLPENTVGISQWHRAMLSNSQENMTTVFNGKSEQAEAVFRSPQLGLVPLPGVSFDNVCAGYGHVFASAFNTQSSSSSVWSPIPTRQREVSPCPISSSLHSDSEILNLEQGYRSFDEATNNSTEQTMHEQENNVEFVEEVRPGSPTAARSASSSLCSCVVGHLNSSLYGSICNRSDGSATLATAIGRTTGPETASDEVPFTHDGFKEMSSHRSSQREAALTKFRLKRKDRCYEKKVRYQSRKRLAEQRPRVKGQFVRQVQPDVPPADADFTSEIQ